ncbi:efflux RND transporter periplasmic adaptor subunit [Niveibacterium sp. SC-1]|uniref:efflux RND transporter periplasmic adaptor subunit n=1 Tax=Niveibacterium sp. SC-1 TaxID=3135646 RepID=UPI00311E42B5
MKTRPKLPILILLLISLGLAACKDDKKAEAVPAAAASAPAAAKAALTVSTVRAEQADWSLSLSANGTVSAWQEAAVGPEIGGLRVTEVLVNVGDNVKRGQTLARLASETVEADLAQTRAQLVEAQATLEEARANAERYRQLRESGMSSQQQLVQAQTAENTARARVDAQHARIKAEELRMAHTRIFASDDGVISARSATVGAVVQAGQELFRLIRGGRLEWRAEVTGAELSRVKPGMGAKLTLPDGSQVEGKVRALAPTIDPQTRNGLVYVDLAADGPARAGMFARGEIALGQTRAMSLPQSAVVLRDGFSYAFVVEGEREGARVRQTKVGTGRRVGDRVEVLSGLKPEEVVVAGGGAFLSDGDLVRVAAAPAAQTASQ